VICRSRQLLRGNRSGLRACAEVLQALRGDAEEDGKERHGMSDTLTIRSTGRRIVVAGGGIAGAEAALTLALGLPEDDVLLVGRWPSVRLLPDLVYVPFGVSPRRIDIPLDRLAEHGVEHVVAEIDRVDVTTRTLHTSAGPIEFDILVAAPGAKAREHGHHSLRSLDDATRLAENLAALVHEARDGEPRTITIRAESEDSWTAPACETAMLIGNWVQAQGLAEHVDVLLATSDSNAFEWFGPIAETEVDAALARAGVHVATGVPSGRFDELGGDVIIEFGALEPRTIDGLPGRGPSGWYESQRSFEVARCVFVIGDAINLPYRAGFATAWQARRVLRALGGDLDRLGDAVDGLPKDSVEYQMDLGDGVLRARVARADDLGHPFLGHDADLDIEHGGRPDKLFGLLLHERVIAGADHTFDAPLAYRELLREQQALSH
jgi:hypothetical protein